MSFSVFSFLRSRLSLLLYRPVVPLPFFAPVFEDHIMKNCFAWEAFNLFVAFLFAFVCLFSLFLFALLGLGRVRLT